MTEVRSLPHGLSEAELFQLLWRLRARAYLWTAMIEAPIVTIVFAALRVSPLSLVTVFVSVFGLCFILGALMISSTARSPRGQPARMVRTYTFTPNGLHVDAENGQTVASPYKSIYGARPLKDGMLIEIAKRSGYWIRPAHFATSRDYDQVCAWLVASGKTPEAAFPLPPPNPEP